MTAKRIDGKAAAQAIRDKVAALVSEFVRQIGRPPGLATIIVGEDPASAVYVRSKNRATAEAGMVSFAHNLPATTSEDELLQLVTDLNADSRVDGILVQLPLPRQIDATRVIETIEPAKDVDGFHPVNAGRLASGLPALVPCTPLGCLYLLKQELGDLTGLAAVVVGRSNIVGKPMAQLLLARLHRHYRTFAHSRPAGHGSPRRHRRRCCRPPGNGPRRLAQAWRDCHRRRHQPRPDRRRQGPAGRRRRL